MCIFFFFVLVENLNEDEYNDFDDSDSVSCIQSALPEDLEHIPFEFTRLPQSESIERAKDFYVFMNKRRTIRHFSRDPVPPEIIHYIIRTAGIF